MCLKNINYITDGVGYKVGQIIYGEFHAFENRTPLDKWTVCNNNILDSVDERIYHSGFHIIKYLDDAKRFLSYMKGFSYAKDWQIYKCDYSGVFAEGEDNNLKDLQCVIAAKIYIYSTPLV